MPLTIKKNPITKKREVILKPKPPIIGRLVPERPPVLLADMVYPEMQKVQDMLLKNRHHFAGKVS